MNSAEITLEAVPSAGDIPEEWTPVPIRCPTEQFEQPRHPLGQFLRELKALL